MLVVLLANLVLNLIFYLNFGPNLEESSSYIGVVDAAYNQERLVSVTTYLHSGVEIVFNIVMLVYLIAIAAE